MFNDEFLIDAIEVLKDKNSHYKNFKIPKSNGKLRTICAPDYQLSRLQHIILNTLINKITPHPIAHGFAVGKSPITNAEQHVGAKVTFCVDIKDFFPSIKEERVRKVIKFIFDEHGFTDDNLLNIVTDLVTYKGALPQGACTSPALSNIVMLSFDRKLKALEPIHGCTITRYADDITVSSTYNTNLPYLLPTIIKMINNAGFAVNAKKTRITRNHHRLLITGVVVNKKTNIQKTKRRNLRAKLHNMKIENTTITEQEYMQLRGQIAWIDSLNHLHGEHLLQQLKDVNVENAL